MNACFDWLPSLILLTDYGGRWDRYLETIYECFRQDFVTSRPSFEGNRFGLKRHPVVQGKEATFWHLISEGKSEPGRLPDLRRCERIRWPRPMIDAVATGSVKWWRNRRGSESRVVIALSDFSYIVVLAERKGYVLLWTAYCVEKEHKKRTLEKEYQASVGPAKR